MGDGDNKPINTTEQKERNGTFKSESKTNTQATESPQKPESLLKKFTNLFKRENKKYPVEKDVELLPKTTNNATPQSKTEANTDKFVKEYDFEKTFPPAQYTPPLDSKGFVVEIDHSAKTQKETSVPANKPKIDDLVITDIKFFKRKEPSPDRDANDKHRRKHSHSHDSQKSTKSGPTPETRYKVQGTETNYSFMPSTPEKAKEMEKQEIGQKPRTPPAERKGLERGSALKRLLSSRSKPDTGRGGRS